MSNPYVYQDPQPGPYYGQPITDQQMQYNRNNPYPYPPPIYLPMVSMIILSNRNNKL